MKSTCIFLTLTFCSYVYRSRHCTVSDVALARVTLRRNAMQVRTSSRRVTALDLLVLEGKVTMDTPTHQELTPSLGRTTTRKEVNRPWSSTRHTQCEAGSPIIPCVIGVIYFPDISGDLLARLWSYWGVVRGFVVRERLTSLENILFWRSEGML